MLSQVHDQHDAQRRVSTGDQPRLDTDERGGVSIWLVLVVVLLAISVSLALYVDQRADVATPPQSEPSFSSTEPPLAVPGLDLAVPPPAAPVLPPVDPASIPTVSAAALRQALQDTLASPDLGRHVGYAVAELGSPELIIATDIYDAFTPASTLKLLTTTAALEALGPDHRFVTSVVSGARPDALVLVGGGDPLLTAVRPAAPESSPAFPEVASLDDLAAQVARRLRSDGIRTVSMTYDDSLFTGPATNPAWEPSYIPESIVSPVSALWVDEGRTDLENATRVGAPAAYAAQRFAELLAERGVSVRGVTTRGVSVRGVTARGVTAPGVAREGRAPDPAEEMARVESAPLAEIVQHIIEFSDNEASEVLLRHVAIAAGLRGSSVKGVEAMTSTLAELGVELSGAEIFDGSGLSRRSVVPVPALVDVLQVVGAQDNPHLRSVVSALPVAGFNGSLAERFVESAPRGLGVVRAKTGTLTGVHALAGTATTRKGSVLVFAVMADRVPVAKTLSARAQLDRVAAALSTCRC